MTYDSLLNMDWRHWLQFITSLAEIAALIGIIRGKSWGLLVYGLCGVEYFVASFVIYRLPVSAIKPWLFLVYVIISFSGWWLWRKREQNDFLKTIFWVN